MKKRVEIIKKNLRFLKIILKYRNRKFNKALFMKIIVFGGTFDPIHNAHLNIVHHVLTNGICDQVLIIPAWIPPHKNIKKITPYEIRRQMIEASVNDCRNVFISDIEKENKDKSYTVKTLSVLRTMF